jgi:hypothetical protein
MRNTVENSEWHREANVFVHTKMVMDEYMKRVEGCNLPFDVFKLGLIASYTRLSLKPIAFTIYFYHKESTFI